MRFTFYPLALSVLLIAGCGGGPDDEKTTVPVSGQVAVNGAPLAGARVAFWAEGAPKAATGITDAEGKFQLSMYALNDGAMVGTHKITISKDDPNAAASAQASTDQMLSDPTAMTDMYNKTQDAAAAGKEPEIPVAYTSQTTTPLKETVTEEGPNQFVLQIQK